MYPYPEGVGLIIPATVTLSLNSAPKSFDNTIITIFGLPSTGKGTLSKALAQRLGLPVFDTGILYRSITYYFSNLSLEPNQVNLDILKSHLELDLIDGAVIVKIDGQILPNSLIRNPEIDSKIGLYAKQPFVRAFADRLIAQFVSKTSFVTDGRGANDGYLLEAERQGVKVIRVLLQAEQSERIRRRFIDYLGLERGTNITSTVVENLWKTCEETVKLRDKEEIIKEKTLNLGMVTDQTGVLDTTKLTVDEAVEAVLGWI